MDLPDVAVLPTLLAKVATLPGNKQRMLLAVVGALEALPPNAPTPEWITSLTKPPDVVPAVVATDAQPPPVHAFTDSVKGNVEEAKVETLETSEKIDVKPAATQPNPVIDPVGDTAPVPASTTHPFPANTIIFRIFSTYGTGTSVGLTELEFLDGCENRVDVNGENIAIRSNCVPGATGMDSGSLSALVDRHPHSTDEAHMWLVSLSSDFVAKAKASSQPLVELEITLPPAAGVPVKCVVWNYNRSTLLSSVGAKEAEFILNGKSVWKGILRKGTGRSGSNTFTSVPLVVTDRTPSPLPPPQATVAVTPDVVSPSTAVSAKKLPRRSSRGSISMWLSSDDANTSLQSVSPRTSAARASSEQPVKRASVISDSTPAVEPEKAVVERKVIVGNSKPSRDAPPAIPSSQSFATRLAAIPAAPRYDDTGSSGPSDSYIPSVMEHAPAVKGRRSSIHRQGSGSLDAPAVGKSLQDSWNSLDVFQKTNRGRISSLPQVSPTPSGPLEKNQDAMPVKAPGVASIDDNDTLQELSSSLFAPVVKPVTQSHSTRRLGTGRQRTDGVTGPAPSTDDLTTSQLLNSSFVAGLLSGGVDLNASMKLEDGMTGGKVAIAGMLAMMEEHSKLTSEVRPTAPEVLDTSVIDDSVMRFVDELGLDRSQMPALVTGDVPVCDIPEMPMGRVLTIRIYSTWGDPHYVGLAGIDIFDGRGDIVTFKDYQSSIRADPPDVNVLPGYGSDPRVVANLLDGVNNTCDDLHVWLAPFSPGKVNTITITLDDRTTLSMLRIWNYNKSRIHSYRGIRLVSIELDGTRIFEGEIKKAFGAIATIDQNSEVILFTKDATVLKAIELFEVDRLRASAGENASTEFDSTSAVLGQVLQQLNLARPKTGGRRASIAPDAPPFKQALEENGAPVIDDVDRPKTSAVIPAAKAQPSNGPRRSQSSAQLASAPTPAIVPTSTVPDYCPVVDTSVVLATIPSIRRLQFDFLTTWGDQYYAGLSGLEVIVAKPYGSGAQGIVTHLPLETSMLSAKPRDINTDGYTGDKRTLDKLIDGVNITQDDLHMWLIPFSPGGHHTLTVDFGAAHRVVAVKVWNYNKTAEDTYRGVKQLTVRVDGTLIPQYVYLRPAPGHALFDFCQVIRFTQTDSGSVSLLPEFPAVASVLPTSVPSTRGVSVQQDYDTPIHPCGQLLKFVFWTTQGDVYYIGLDALVLLDVSGARIPIRPSNIHAIPASVNDLAQGSVDPRTPANLALPFNPLTSSNSQAWLAPLAHSLQPGAANLLYVALNQPVALGGVQLWNYSKDPARGVGNVEVWMDELLIYCGEVKAATVGAPRQPHTILFSNSATLVDKHRAEVPYCGAVEQDVLCINERRVMQATRAKKPDPTAHGVMWRKFVHPPKEQIMPEIVEVEIACRYLRRHCVGKIITEVLTNESGGGPRNGLPDDIVIEGTSPEKIQEALTGAKFLGMERKGKYMWWATDRKPWLVCHFGMDGGFVVKGHRAQRYVRAKDEPEDVWPPKFTKLEVGFNDGTRVAFINIRRLGRLWLKENPVAEPPVSLLGLDPLQDFPLDKLTEMLQLRSCPIKAAILDQSVTAGVGNWIADESLFQSRIHPTVRCCDLTPTQIATLHAKIVEIVQYAVDHEDYSEYPEEWLFHSRWSKGKASVVKTHDGHVIKFLTVGGRTSAVVEALQGRGRPVASLKRTKTVAVTAAAPLPDDDGSAPHDVAVKPMKRSKTVAVSASCVVAASRRSPRLKQ